MSTRSNILITNNDTKIWLYRHYDGYLKEAGYNIASCLAQSTDLHEFMEQLLSQKHEPSMYREARPIYEFTSGMHGDIEYLYKINFFGTRSEGGVRFIVQERQNFDDVELEETWKLLLDETIKPITAKEVSDKVSLISEARLKVS